MTGDGSGLVVTGLCAAYGAARVIHDLALQVRPGEAVGLVGRNGMGKTTLVRTLMGLDSPTCTGGEVLWDGSCINRLPSHRRARRGFGYVPQARHVFGVLTVEENLLTTARPTGSGDDWTLERVYDLFPRLQERRRNKARNLSGGEQQMVAIGRALMTNPRLLIMDEPSEGLAPAVVGQIRDRLIQLKGGAMSVLLVEQNIALAMALSDRLYVLELGQVVYDGDPQTLAADRDLQRRLLGV